MKKKILLRSLALIALSSPVAHAESLDQEFRARSWTQGLHLSGGAGLSSTGFSRNDAPTENLGIGLSLKTELGYYLSEKFAIELGSLVNLTQVRSDFLLWDTQFILGVRTRIGRFFSAFNGVPYYRAFGGWGPTVSVYKTPQSGADRIHAHGPVAGMAIGQIYETSYQTPYFIELGISFHEVHVHEGVREAGVIPQTLYRYDETNDSHTVSVQLTVGGWAF